MICPDMTLALAEVVSPNQPNNKPSPSFPCVLVVKGPSA